MGSKLTIPYSEFAESRKYKKNLDCRPSIALRACFSGKDGKETQNYSGKFIRRDTSYKQRIEFMDGADSRADIPILGPAE